MNLELGTWNLELGTWNSELETWNSENGLRHQQSIGRATAASHAPRDFANLNGSGATPPDHAPTRKRPEWGSRKLWRRFRRPSGAHRISCVIRGRCPRLVAGGPSGH